MTGRLHFSLRRQTAPWLLMLLSLYIALPALAADATPVIAARAEQQNWSTPLEALGTLRADESVTLSATVTETVAELNFNDGDTVDAGQLLIRLDDAEEQAELRAAQAQRAERNNVLQRSTQLQSRNLAPRADVEDNRAQLRRVEAEIDAIEARLADHRLRAPFVGVVGFRDISTGALVTPGMELVTLDKLDRVKLDFSVPAVHLSVLHSGLSLTAHTDAYPDEVFEGEVASLGTRIDPVSRSISVRAVLPNPGLRLRPGMLMEVMLEHHNRQALVLPEEALIPSGERQFVLVIDENDDNRVSRVEVKIGERRAGRVEILDGLQPGDLVVSHGVQRARDGERVSLLGIDDGETDIAELLERSRDLSSQDDA